MLNKSQGLRESDPLVKELRVEEPQQQVGLSRRRGLLDFLCSFAISRHGVLPGPSDQLPSELLQASSFLSLRRARSRLLIR